VYYYLSRAIKRRFINELQDSFSRHPQFKKIVPWIQDRFAYEERPAWGIVVKNASASRIQYSADNYQGTVISYIQKADVMDDDGNRYPGNSIEWVREDTCVIVENDPSGATFPSPPGLYYIDWVENDEFMVDPLLDIVREFLVEFDPGDISIGYSVIVSAGVIHPGTLFVYTQDNYTYVEGTHYTVDYATGTITFIVEIDDYSRIYADYKYPTDSRGPYKVPGPNTFINDAIPGVIMAFGRAYHQGDKSAIIVTQKREIQALEYGGKWEISLTFDVLAQDPIQLEEIADLVLMYVWGEKKNHLEFEGLIIQDISHGGEADEVYDETGQNLYYLASMDLSVQADWNLHVPVPFQIYAIEFVEDLQAYRTAQGDEILALTNTLRVVPSLTPYMPKAGLTHNYERIG